MLLLKKGFTLTESVVAIFLISLVFTIIASGLSAVFNTLSSVQSIERTTEFENFIARWVFLQDDSSKFKDEINQAFFGTATPAGYPVIKNVVVQNVGTLFNKFTFQIEYLPNKFKSFVVYKYRGY